MYYTYMLRCKDNSIYSGIAYNLEERMKTHFLGGDGGAKYVISRGATRLEVYWISKNRSDASKLEYRLKKLTKIQKESLISGDCGLEDYFSESIDISLYVRGSLEEENLKMFAREMIV